MYGAYSKFDNGTTSTEYREREREMFYLTTHSTHFIYGYMASDIWLRTILIVRKETRCRHIGYSYRLTARVLLYAPSHRQDNTYHGLCYTSRGALAGTRNSSRNIEDRGRAIAWLQGGNTQRNVAVRLGVSQSVVGRLWQRFQATNSVRNRPRSGRPRSTTNREDRYITNMALRQRTTTARRLRDNLRTATGTRVSDQTIRNRLRANNLRCRRQSVRPPLLPRHRTARRGGNVFSGVE